MTVHQHVDNMANMYGALPRYQYTLGKTKIYLHESRICNNEGGTILKITKKYRYHTPIAGAKFLFLSFLKSVIFLPSSHWWMYAQRSQLCVRNRSKTWRHKERSAFSYITAEKSRNVAGFLWRHENPGKIFWGWVVWKHAKLHDW